MPERLQNKENQLVWVLYSYRYAINQRNILMALFFKNPITLILFRTIHPDLDLRLQAFLSTNTFLNRTKPIDNILTPKETSNVLRINNLEISKLIAKELNIGMRILSPDILPKDNDFIDFLENHSAYKFSYLNFIYSGSDMYCKLGFQNYLKYTRKKIKLKSSWSRNFNFYQNHITYLFDQPKFHKNKSEIKTINLDLANHFLSLAKKSVLPKVIYDTKSKRLNSCLLVLPPSEYGNPKFFNAFFSFCLRIAKDENLEILIKPHRWDKTDYKTKFKNKNSIHSLDLSFKLMPVEFLFNESFVKKIITVPSSSLVFTDPKKTTIICPRDRILFGNQYLDQTVFMRHLGLDYEVI